jgi:hypothetical protein
MAMMVDDRSLAREMYGLLVKFCKTFRLVEDASLCLTDRATLVAYAVAAGSKSHESHAY